MERAAATATVARNEMVRRDTMEEG